MTEEDSCISRWEVLFGVARQMGLSAASDSSPVGTECLVLHVACGGMDMTLRAGVLQSLLQFCFSNVSDSNSVATRFRWGGVTVAEAHASLLHVPTLAPVAQHQDVLW